MILILYYISLPRYIKHQKVKRTQKQRLKCTEANICIEG